ncbi:GIY-YIG nuclease family protein [Streptomyces actinomycinicus]|uniref:GIY-YIG nuclease family protein n=1 Tax=Streptomyces actinomycinicus TaxID=1695166 RepID=A0A937EQY0_9ACTN|nr:GIY-YIG nuclease family protein [Streptomyces actinomycinicus]
MTPKQAQIERVYVIGSPGCQTVKIGRSRDVEQRLRALQSMSPLPLQLLCTFPGGAELEAALHRYFAAQRTHGEWFDLSGADPAAVVSAAVEEVVRGNLKGKRYKPHLRAHFKIERFVPEPTPGNLLTVDPQRRKVGAWPMWVPPPRGAQQVADPFTCRCRHPIAAHNPVRPHYCMHDDVYDSGWCSCLGYEGPLPPQLTGYDLPGHDWRLWRPASLPPASRRTAP